MSKKRNSAIEPRGNVTEPEIAAIIDILRISMYVHIEAVRSTVSLEYSPKNADRTRLSTDASSRENQLFHLNWRGWQAFRDEDVNLAPMRLRGKWILPYRRKAYSEVSHPGLRRLNEVLRRMQDGLLRANASLGGHFETDEGAALASRLVEALTSWDLPTVASIADEHPSLREGLQRHLRITNDELALMRSLKGDEWDSLGDSEEYYQSFYQKKCG